MEKGLEEVVTELNDISAALDFLGAALECYESEGKSLNGGGVAYLVKAISKRSSKLSDACWSIKMKSHAIDNCGVNES